MKAKIENGRLIIEIEIQPYTSKTGKTLVIASTHGNEASAAVYEGKPVVIGLNAYIKKG